MTKLSWGYRIRVGRALLFASTALGSSVVVAQVADNGTGSVLSEVIVTAQKHSENIQNVPETVSVVGAQQIGDYHITQLADIGAYIPGLQVDSGGSPGQTQLSIRGIAPVSSNATVGTYIDETPLGATSLHDRGAYYSLDILPYDVERIEVLEGPQGTLYGANSLGGLVKYVLTTPNLESTEIRAGTDAFGIDGSGGVGGGARISINTPIIQDKLGLIASFAVENTPGYIDNAQTGEKDQNSVRQQSGRLALLWQISPDASLKLGALYQESNASGNASVALDSTTLQPLVGDLKDNNYLPNTFRSTLYYYTADFNWNLHWANFISATSYSDQRSNSVTDDSRQYGPLITDIGGPANALSAFSLALSTKKFTQEFRLSSPSAAKLEWLIGTYYDHEDGSNLQGLSSQNPDGSPITALNPLFVGSLPTTYQEYAFFGGLTYHFTDQFDIAGGGRYAHNNQTYTEIVYPGSPVLAATYYPGQSSEGVSTYSVSPRYRITESITAYARVATGYQPGGPNSALPDVPPAVNSSTLTDYEVGLKCTLWDHRASLNVSAFDLEWNRIQVQGTTSGGLTYTTNGGTARSRGFEVDGTIRPFGGLSLAGTVNYTDAVFTQAIPSVGALAGNVMPFVPRWNGSIRADYAYPITSEWTGRLGAGLRLVGEHVRVRDLAGDCQERRNTWSGTAHRWNWRR